MERHEAAARGEHQRELRCDVRMLLLILRRADVGRQRGKTETLENRRLELNLAAPRAEAVLLILVELLRRVVVAVLLDEIVVAVALVTRRRDDVVEGLFLGLPRPHLGILAAGQSELAPERVVGVAVVERLDCTLRANQRVGDAVVVMHDGTLERACAGQNVIGVERRRGDPVVDRDHELDALVGLEDHLRVAVAADRIGGVHDERANLIRIAGDNRLEDARTMGLAHPLGGGSLAPRCPRRIGDHLIAGPRSELELVGADLLGLLLLGQALVGFHLLVGDVVLRRAGHEVAAGAVEVAADSAHDGTRVHAGAGVLAELVPRAAPLDVARSVVRVHAGGLADELRVEPGLLGSPACGVGLDVLLELVEADAPFLHELLVVQSLEDDGVEHRERQGRVRARSEREPKVGVSSGLRVARVDADDLETLLLEVGVAAHAGHVRRTGVDAPQQEAPAASQVGLEGAPAADGRLDHEGRDPAQKRVVEAVRAAELVHETAARPVIGAQRSSGGRDRLGARLFLDLVELGCDLLDRLIVGYLNPFVLALGTGALERVVHAGRMVKELESRGATAAQASLTRDVIGISLDSDALAVLDVSQDTAVLMTEVTCGFLDFYAWGVEINFLCH